MKIQEGKLYFIKDIFLDKYGKRYNLMGNKTEKIQKDLHTFALKIVEMKNYYGLFQCLSSMKNI